MSNYTEEEKLSVAIASYTIAQSDLENMFKALQAEGKLTAGTEADMKLVNTYLIIRRQVLERMLNEKIEFKKNPYKV